MNELLEHRIRMMGSKPVEYEAYPDMYCIGVDCTAPNQQFHTGYYMDLDKCLRIIYDGVDVTAQKSQFIIGGSESKLICPDAGRHYFHIKWHDGSGCNFQIGFPYFRFPTPKLGTLVHRINSHKEWMRYIDCLDSAPQTKIHWQDSFPANLVQVRVPIGAKAAYVAADKWKGIASKIVEYDFKIKS